VLADSECFPPTGDIVGLAPFNVPISSFALDSQQRGRGGVVYRVTERSITISFPRGADEEATLASFSAATHNLVRLANDITYKRFRRAMECLRLRATSREATSENDHLGPVLFGFAEPRFVGNFRERFQLVPFNSNLNEFQQEAIDFALSAIDLALIHGPPGTGKAASPINHLRVFSSLTLKCDALTTPAHGTHKERRRPWWSSFYSA